MIRTLVLAAAVAASVSAAEAGCSKSSLNGLWAIEEGGESATVMIAGGVFYFTGDKFAITTFSSSTCRGDGTYTDTSLALTRPAKFVVEASARDSSGKPNRMIAAFTVDNGANYTAFILSRR